jgi:hypothetical protein
MKTLVLLGAIVTLVLALGSVGYYASIGVNTYKAVQGDQNAVGQIMNDTASQIVDEVTWSAGVIVVLEVLGVLAAIGLPVTALIAFIKKNCD